MCFDPFLIFNTFLFASTAAAIIFALLSIHSETKDWLIRYLVAISSWLNMDNPGVKLDRVLLPHGLLAPLCLLLVLPLDGAAILI